MSAEQLLNIMIEIQKKVEETATITTEEVMQDLIGRLKECQSA
ncbi:hypothetical protein [Bacillus sp. JJ1562]